MTTIPASAACRIIEVTEIFGHSRPGEIIAPDDGLYHAGLTLRKKTD
ncbi:MAG: hypothetical protein JOZ08_10440 [Verrucomicrobia bacterium]|nr:hypothetical protein [Verrucomicrobiota bacterium]